MSCALPTWHPRLASSTDMVHGDKSSTHHTSPTLANALDSPDSGSDETQVNSISRSNSTSSSTGPTPSSPLSTEGKEKANVSQHPLPRSPVHVHPPSFKVSTSNKTIVADITNAKGSLSIKPSRSIRTFFTPSPPLNSTRGSGLSPVRADAPCFLPSSMGTPCPSSPESPLLSMQPSSSIEFRQGDWMCVQATCSCHNYSRNSTCGGCGALKPSQISSRPGFAASRASRGGVGPKWTVPLSNRPLHLTPTRWDQGVGFATGSIRTPQRSATSPLGAHSDDQQALPTMPPLRYPSSPFHNPEYQLRNSAASSHTGNPSQMASAGNLSVAPSFDSASADFRPDLPYTFRPSMPLPLPGISSHPASTFPDRLFVPPSPCSLQENSQARGVISSFPHYAYQQGTQVRSPGSAPLHPEVQMRRSPKNIPSSFAHDGRPSQGERRNGVPLTKAQAAELIAIGVGIGPGISPYLDKPFRGSDLKGDPPPIINSGSEGPMLVQPGDWICSLCYFVNWRRRKCCMRCYPLAQGNSAFARSLQLGLVLAHKAAAGVEIPEHELAALTKAKNNYPQANSAGGWGVYATAPSPKQPQSAQLPPIARSSSAHSSPSHYAHAKLHDDARFDHLVRSACYPMGSSSPSSPTNIESIAQRSYQPNGEAPSATSLSHLLSPLHSLLRHADGRAPYSYEGGESNCFGGITEATIGAHVNGLSLNLGVDSRNSGDQASATHPIVQARSQVGKTLWPPSPAFRLENDQNTSWSSGGLSLPLSSGFDANFVTLIPPALGSPSFNSPPSDGSDSLGRLATPNGRAVKDLWNGDSGSSSSPRKRAEDFIPGPSNASLQLRFSTKNIKEAIDGIYLEQETNSSLTEAMSSGGRGAHMSSEILWTHRGQDEESTIEREFPRPAPIGTRR